MAITVETVQKRIRAELSVSARLGYTGLAVAGLSMAGVVTSLLLTEPSLPVRTQVAFILIALGGITWAAFAAWVLARRRVLLASHHVTASMLATTLAAIFLAGAIVFRDRAGNVAVIVNAAMLVVAVAWLIRARRRVRSIEARRAAIEDRRQQ